jgi:thiamine biosynthesis lipoprotein
VTDDVHVQTIVVMGTFVTIQVIGHGAGPQEIRERTDAVERAFGWFHRIEECCSRFDAQSEAMQLTAQIGVPVAVSAILFEAVQFALLVAEDSGGAFDPTVGYQMETSGFNREYRTGQIVRTALEPQGPVSYRDVRLDPDGKTITLGRPLILDLGAVAKGLAIDLAARELESFEHFAIDAGGDLFLAGCRPDGAPWSVGIRHPRDPHQLFEAIRVTNSAVCTSGDYERRSPGADGGHHIIDPRTGVPAGGAASVTVVAPTAMLADALATAAFVLGPELGIQLLDRHGVDGLVVSPSLERHATRGLCSDVSILQNPEGPSHDRPGHPGVDRRAWGGHQADRAGTG